MRMHQLQSSVKHRHKQRGLNHSPVFLDLSVDKDGGVFLGPAGEIVASGEPPPPAHATPGLGPLGVPTQKGDVQVIGPVLPPREGHIDSQALPDPTHLSAVIAGISIGPTTAPTDGQASIVASTSVSPSASASADQSMTSSGPTETTETVSSPSQPTSSAEAPATAGQSSSQGASSNPESHPLSHNTGLYVAIALGAVAGLGIIIALVAWWVRLRSRSRRRSLNRMATWPWDHDRLGLRQGQGQDTLEGGLGRHDSMLEHWNGNRMVLSASQREFRYDPSIIEQLPPNHASFPIFPPRAHTHMNTHTNVGSPFVTVPLYTRQSVPDLVQDVGTLKITNLMPGDISGGETSRASTALGILHTSSVESSPDEGSMQGRTWDTPWAPLRTRKSLAGYQSRKADEDGRLDKLLPFPGDRSTQHKSPARTGSEPEGWAASIRSNLFNALSAVVGGSTSTSQASLASSSGDYFTTPPPRRIRAHGSRGSPGALSRSATASSTSTATEWTLEETGAGRGVVHIRTREELGPAHHADPFSDEVQLPATALTPARSRTSDAPAATNPFVDSIPTTEDSDMHRTDDTESSSRIDSHPPRLPDIPNVSRSLSGSASASESESEQFSEVPKRKHTRAAHKKQSQYRKRTKTKKQRRPTLIARKSSTQDSATSVGSDMSRTSSACSAGMTDTERFVKHVLRERRRRVLEMTVGRAKTKRSRATTISRRRSKERNKREQRREPETSSELEYTT